MSPDRIVYAAQIDEEKLASYGYEFGGVYGGEVVSFRDQLDPARMVPKEDPLFGRIAKSCLKPPPSSLNVPALALLALLAWAATVAPALVALAESAP